MHPAPFLSRCPRTQLYLASSHCYQYPPMSPTDTNGQKLDPSICSEWKEITWRKPIVLCVYLLNTMLYYIRAFSYKYIVYAKFIPAIRQSPLPLPSALSLVPWTEKITCVRVTWNTYTCDFSLPTNKETTIEKRHDICLLETRLI